LDFNLFVIMVKAGRPAEAEERVLEPGTTSGVKAVRLVDGVPLLVASSTE
jgi:acyl-coenzyme A thioesterase PaaI-like protein